MTTALTRSAGSAFALTVTVPWSDVKKIYDLVFDELASQIEIEGFRPGKAPRELVEPRLDKNKILSEAINKIIPEAYQKALAEHGLKPIVSPQIHLLETGQEKDWQFLIKAAERPKIDLDGYKQALAEINAKGKIWTPSTTLGTTTDKPGEEAEKQKKMEEIIAKLLEVCKVELAEILVESEVNRLITQLVEDVRSAGLTFEQYLQSSKQSSETVRQKYHQQAQTALKLEFILEAAAEDLDIKVEKEEIETVINKETDPQKKQALTDQSYVLASLIRRDKTLAKLTGL